MVFSSLTFLYLFFPLCIGLYFLVPSSNGKNWVLVGFSIVFYAWGEPFYVILLAFSAFLNYVFGMVMGNWKRAGRDTKGLLWAVVAVDIGLLGVFKYTGFLVENINALTGLSFSVPQIVLPIGISFYTFQALSYVIDVHRGHVAVQKSYRDFLLYVALFPQLIAGPIVRYSEIEPQMAQRKIDVKSIFQGVTRFCVGLGKKVLIANYAGKVASQLLDGNLEQLSTLGGWLGIILFTFMIYFDFSGYSDMAIGLGRIFGFHYSENFNYPYISTSITSFWRRWHISLSSFFRDYVYIPLGGNRRHQVINLLVVWCLTGLWHGASWNFALWGLYFFVLLYIEKKSKPILDKIHPLIRYPFTMFFVVLGWALFYCTDFTRLGQTIGVLFGTFGAGLTNGTAQVQLASSWPLLLLCFIGSTPVPKGLGVVVSNLCFAHRRTGNGRMVYAALCFLFQLAILAFATVSLVGSSYNPFLYFRF